jgi:hypothetical protein
VSRRRCFDWRTWDELDDFDDAPGRSARPHDVDARHELIGLRLLDARRAICDFTGAAVRSNTALASGNQEIEHTTAEDIDSTSSPAQEKMDGPAPAVAGCRSSFERHVF